MKRLFWILLILPSFLYAQSDITESNISAQRSSFVAQFLLNPNSPLDSNSIHGLRFFEISKDYEVPTIILPLTDTTTITFPTTTGELKNYRRYAKIYFKLDGEFQQLTVFQSLSFINHPLLKDKLFVPFWDLTNGDETYGGGRYLTVSKAHIDQRNLTLDFNKAYNPWCAYGGEFSCPIPPAENRLTIEVAAGEAAFQRPKT